MTEHLPEYVYLIKADNEWPVHSFAHHREEVSVIFVRTSAIVALEPVNPLDAEWLTRVHTHHDYWEVVESPAEIEALMFPKPLHQGGPVLGPGSLEKRRQT